MGCKSQTLLEFRFDAVLHHLHQLIALLSRIQGERGEEPGAARNNRFPQPRATLTRSSPANQGCLALRIELRDLALKKALDRYLN